MQNPINGRKEKKGLNPRKLGNSICPRQCTVKHSPPRESKMRGINSLSMTLPWRAIQEGSIIIPKKIFTCSIDLCPQELPQAKGYLIVYPWSRPNTDTMYLEGVQHQPYAILHQ